MYAIKTLVNQYLRFIITVFGIALCVVLMLFLLAIYRGAADDEIVLDYSFAAKFNIQIGDQVLIKNDTLTVTGLSSGTNLFVL